MLKGTKFDFSHDHWLYLASTLPPEGITSIFRTETACKRRFESIRWPDGKKCPKCLAPDFSKISTRKTFECAACKHQYSATSGTILHGSKLSFRQWFLGAELVIMANAANKAERLTIQKFAGELKLSYRTARTLRSKLFDDLKQDAGGLWGSILCVNEADANLHLAKCRRK